MTTQIDPSDLTPTGLHSVIYRKGDTFDPASVRWINDLGDLREVVAAIRSATEIVYDLETTGLDEHATAESEGGVPARVVMAQYTLPQVGSSVADTPPTYLVPLSHPESPLRGHWRAAFAALTEEVQDSGVPIIGQNLKFDLRWTYAHTGIDLSGQFGWDTRVSSHLLDENSTTSLKPCAQSTFNIPRWDDFSLASPGAAERVPLIDLGLYGARDTYWTWRLACAHRWRMGLPVPGVDPESIDPPANPEELIEYRLGRLAVWSSMPMSAALTAIEQRGMRVDRDWVINAIRSEEATAEGAFRELTNRYPVDPELGPPSLAPTSKWFLEWADLAMGAGDLRMLSATAKGRPQWSKEVLRRLDRQGSPVAGRLLEYRGAVKRLEFLRAWLGYLTPASRIHPTYNVGQVVTGRLSSSGPNVQQITRALKPAFIPDDGMLIVEADYSQIELRVAAWIAQCEPMLRAYRAGEDLHKLTAARITGALLSDVTPEQRQLAKAVNFGLIYGMSAGGLQAYADAAYDVQLTGEEAQEAHAAFFAAYPELLKWHARARVTVAQDGQVVSPVGRVRRLPGIWGEGEFHAERQAINSPVQGFASELTQLASSYISGHLPGSSALPDVQVIGTVHDSLILQVPADDWQRATARAMRRMIDLGAILDRLGCDFDVPLEVEAKVGTRWGLGDVGVIA